MYLRLKETMGGLMLAATAKLFAWTWALGGILLRASASSP
jgi:hypothetical protein